MKGRKLLMIPGPIEFEPDVLHAMSIATNSHVAPNFINVFGSSLELMRNVWKSQKGQLLILRISLKLYKTLKKQEIK
jgi:alanine-glyoxylate transaminase/serine-glyoxylate transaminase/serine-pyruvate transaminase